MLGAHDKLAHRQRLRGRRGDDIGKRWVDEDFVVMNVRRGVVFAAVEMQWQLHLFGVGFDFGEVVAVAKHVEL